jgi:tetratricopeptide (TPR) repeat protein
MIKTVLITFFICFWLIGFSQNKADSLNDAAMESYKKDHDAAIELLQEALQISRDNQNVNGIARTKNNLGIVYRDLGKFDEARTLSEEALSITKDSIILGSAYNNIGACYRSLGNYELSLNNYLSALRIYENLNSRAEIATVSNNIGMVYSYLGMES